MNPKVGPVTDRATAQQVLLVVRRFLDTLDPTPGPALAAPTDAGKALHRVQAWIAGLPDSVDNTGPTCSHCGRLLEGRQQEWCSQACRHRARRAANAL